MTPTTNQILAACICSTANTLTKAWYDYVLAKVSPIPFATGQILNCLEGQVSSPNSDSIAHYFKEVGEPTTLRLPVRILDVHSTKLDSTMWNDLQIPIEPVEAWLTQCLLYSWVINHRRSVRLVNFEGEPTLLGQAYLAGLSFDVLLAFELAGRTAPKLWETWRPPNPKDPNDHVPTKGTCKSLPHFGDCHVHYHNGEYALISSAGYMHAEVVRVESLVSTVQKDLASLVSNNRPKKPKVPELDQAQVRALADKYA